MKEILNDRIFKIISHFNDEYYSTYSSLCNRKFDFSDLKFIKKSLIEILTNFNIVKEKLILSNDFSDLASCIESLYSVYSCLDNLRSTYIK